MPSISAIVPVFNGARFLTRCVESIRRQRYTPLEIVIIDDGSTDETPALIARLGADVRTVRQENAGPSAARNHGLRIASGEAIAFLDVDDTWPDGKLAAQAAQLRDDPSLAIVQGTIVEGDAEPYFNVNLGSLLFRRSVFAAIGPFDETLRMGEDVDLLIRAWEHGLAKASTADVALHYHQHGDSLTSGIDRRLVLASVLKRRLARRRAGGAVGVPRQSIAEYLGWGPP
jgi:glycosyltransferase involved in cell wall biosynthesis